MTRNKTIITAFLLGVFLIPLWAFLALEANRIWVKFEQREALEREQLQIMVLQKSDIHWVETGKELKINGHYFDVYSVRALVGGNIEVKGIFDYQEQAIEAQTNDLMDDNESPSLLVAKKISSIVLFQVAQSNKELISKSISIGFCCYINQVMNEPGADVLTPPPKISFFS